MLTSQNKCKQHKATVTGHIDTSTSLHDTSCKTAHTLFPQPALLDGVEECMHQVVTIIFGNLERLLLDTFIQTLQSDVNKSSHDAMQTTQ